MTEQDQSWDKFSRIDSTEEAERRGLQRKTVGGFSVPASIPANALDFPVVTELPDDSDDLGAGGIILKWTEREGAADTYKAYIYDYNDRRWTGLDGCSGNNEFTITNWNSDFEFDADSTSVNKLANVLATHISQGCGGESISAGLVQGLNYGYANYADAGNFSVTSTSTAALDTTNLRVSLDCDGSYPVLVIINAIYTPPVGNEMTMTVMVNGAVKTQPGNRLLYEGATGDTVGGAGFGVVNASDINVGVNTFDLAARVGGGTGTIYGTSDNQPRIFAVELKTVEGQITQAKVDNRTVWTPEVIDDWDNRPTNPVDGEIIGYRVMQDPDFARTGTTTEGNTKLIWWLRYNQTDDRWDFSHGDDVIWGSGKTAQVFTNTWTAYPSNAKVEGLPDGNYWHHWTANSAALVTSQAQTVRTRISTDRGTNTSTRMTTADMSTGAGGIAGQDYSVSWMAEEDLTSGQGTNYFTYDGYTTPTNDGQADIIARLRPIYLDN